VKIFNIYFNLNFVGRFRHFGVEKPPPPQQQPHEYPNMHIKYSGSQIYQ